MSLPTIESKDILIRKQATPNPYAFKFVLNIPLTREEKATFYNPVEAENLPLVKDLFSIDGMKQVYLFQNTVTVTHEGGLSDTELAEQVEAVLRTRGPIHNPDFQQSQPKVVKAERMKSDDPIVEKIQEILDRTIRPGLQADGGDLDVIDFSNNELKIAYQGACGGCPSSMMGTLDAIQNILRYELDNDQIVVIPEASY